MTPQEFSILIHIKFLKIGGGDLSPPQGRPWKSSHDNMYVYIRKKYCYWMLRRLLRDVLLKCMSPSEMLSCRRKGRE